jgi:hypothetical protein
MAASYTENQLQGSRFVAWFECRNSALAVAALKRLQ